MTSGRKISFSCRPRSTGEQLVPPVTTRDTRLRQRAWKSISEHALLPAWGRILLCPCRLTKGFLVWVASGAQTKPPRTVRFYGYAVPRNFLKNPELRSTHQQTWVHKAKGLGARSKPITGRQRGGNG